MTDKQAITQELKQARMRFYRFYEAPRWVRWMAAQALKYRTKKIMERALRG